MDTSRKLQTEMIETDLCIIGAGSAGLSAAAGAVQMGARTTLIEAKRMGGDCLNTGCVPSKALLAAAHIAHAARGAAAFGVNVGGININFADVHTHIRSTIAAIEPNDSQERFERLGCRVVRAHARFVDDTTVMADGMHIRARRFILATGSRPALPAIAGLDTTPFLTNESIFELTTPPEHLIVIGAGPIGCELAQAHRRLGARVTLIDAGMMLPKDDIEAVGVVRGSLLADGIDLRERTRIAFVGKVDQGIEVGLDGASPLVGSHLLIATGRRPNVEGLGLEEAGITYDGHGIRVDRRLRTSNRRVFAIGDVAGGLQFTHLAGYHAGVVLRNALLRLPARTNLRAFPWVTFTAPELAHVGLTEQAARSLHGEDVRVSSASFTENDRAVAERMTHGFTKIISRANGRLLGATIVGPHAGELIQLWVLAIGKKMRIGDVAGMIAPYPTLGETGKRAAGSFFTPLIFGPRVRRIVGWLQALG